MVNSLQKGDKVVTSGGVHGTVAGFNDAHRTLLLKVSDNTKIEVERSAVQRVLRSSGDNTGDVSA